MYLTETVSYSANIGTALVTKKNKTKRVETLKKTLCFSLVGSLLSSNNLYLRF